jgi:hypothetical protein
MKDAMKLVLRFSRRASTGIFSRLLLLKLFDHVLLSPSNAFSR